MSWGDNSLYFSVTNHTHLEGEGEELVKGEEEVPAKGAEISYLLAPRDLEGANLGPTWNVREKQEEWHLRPEGDSHKCPRAQGSPLHWG